MPGTSGAREFAPLTPEEARHLEWYREWPCGRTACEEPNWLRARWDPKRDCLALESAHGTATVIRIWIPAGLFRPLHALLFLVAGWPIAPEDIATVERDAERWIQMSHAADAEGKPSEAELFMELAADRFSLAWRLRELLPDPEVETGAAARPKPEWDPKWGREPPEPGG